MRWAAPFQEPLQTAVADQCIPDQQTRPSRNHTPSSHFGPLMTRLARLFPLSRAPLPASPRHTRCHSLCLSTHAPDPQHMPGAVSSASRGSSICDISASVKPPGMRASTSGGEIDGVDEGVSLPVSSSSRSSRARCGPRGGARDSARSDCGTDRGRSSEVRAGGETVRLRPGDVAPAGDEHHQRGHERDEREQAYG